MGLVLILALLALMVATALFTRAPRRSPAHRMPAATATFPANTIPLRVAIHVKNLYDLTIENQMFSADGWYRLEWDSRLEEVIRAAGIPRDRLVEFDNQVELWQSLIEAETPEPLVEPDGRLSQTFRFSARFYIDSIDLHHSPFETIELPIVLETRPDLFSLTRQAVRLEPAAIQSRLVGDYGDVAGYRLNGATLLAGINVYESVGIEQEQAFSQLALRVNYGTDVLAAFLKWILPLLIVMVVVLLAPSLEGSLGDIRLAIPSTALLTLVFLQQTYRAELPATPYPTFLDQLYAYSYLVALGLFLLFVWSSNVFEGASEAERPTVRQRINRLDSLCQGGAVVGFAAWVLVAWHF